MPNVQNVFHRMVLCDRNTLHFTFPSVEACEAPSGQDPQLLLELMKNEGPNQLVKCFDMHLVQTAGGEGLSNESRVLFFPRTRARCSRAHVQFTPQQRRRHRLAQHSLWSLFRKTTARSPRQSRYERFF